MAPAHRFHVQAILVGVAPSGTGWVGWLVLAVIVGFMAVTVLGNIRGRSGQDSSSGDPAFWSLALQHLTMICNLQMTLRPVDDPNYRGILTAAKWSAEFRDWLRCPRGMVTAANVSQSDRPLVPPPCQGSLTKGVLGSTIDP